MYFDNPLVESLVIKHKSQGCTDPDLRDEIMRHMDELIIQVMRTRNLHNIYPYKDESSEADLFQTAWSEIERSLYKFDPSRGTKIFNMATQVANASMLALIKREGRDRRNKPNLEDYRRRSSRQSVCFQRFVTEAKEVLKDNNDFLRLIDCLSDLYETEDKPAEGLMAKLIERSGLPRSKVQKFLAQIKMRASDFSDSPMNEEPRRKPGADSRRYDFEDDGE